mmetsp:Transcript_18493/g.27941  ORF Transcript_18493/g.27941 Transcript_18493/m.27941 type:complete len:241 (+) Transcript_18493:99-821(+)
MINNSFHVGILVLLLFVISHFKSCHSLSLFSRRNALFTATTALTTGNLITAEVTNAEDAPKFVRYPQIRFIAALGDPNASHGTGADQWGLWRDDPGPRGVRLQNADSLIEKGTAPAGWKFDPQDWWLEEHGLIMSQPGNLPRTKLDSKKEVSIPLKRYVVTGDREVTTVLTVFQNGEWELGKGKLYDVTHLPCRSARYTGCSVENANRKDFPVKPGAAMPAVSGCNKQDYAVLFVLGEEA